MEPELREMLIDTVTLYPRTSINGFGDQSFGAPTDFACRIEYTKHILQRSEGETITADGRLWLEVAPTVTVGDDLLLPNGKRGTAQDVTLWRDEVGDHHQEVMFST